MFSCIAIYTCLAVGISSKSYLGDWLFIILKKGKVSCTIVLAVGIQSLVLDKFFSGTILHSTCYGRCYIKLNQFEPFMKITLNVLSNKMSLSVI